ncbi:MAG: DoxX family protein [Chlamydiae bacterium]|nr:DoxX family protein [Chlamydiota bacterium]MBI3265983.1 DoxX family protein [Chlamydiota bacterium]
MAKTLSGTNTESGGKGPGLGKTWISLLRIYLGAYFIHASLGKFTASYIGEFAHLVARWEHNSPYIWYQLFLNHCIAPHAKFFAYFTAIGEFYVGISLVIGFLSGLAALFGILLYANYYLGSQGGESLWHSGLMMVSLLAMLFTNAGRTLGLDKYLSKKILIKYLV